MRYIDLSIIDANDPDVKAWIVKARRRIKTLSSKTTHIERAKYLARANIWSEFKPILIKYYGEKCWYSECSLEGSFADVDHFRPKNRSTDEQGNIILPDGYWWLAYDYLNYRLSCEKSNRSFGDGGKNDMFPLKAGTAPATQGNSNDVPILLDPCDENDTKLIDCDEAGSIIALSTNQYDIERIRLSQKAYNWNCFKAGRKEARIECQIALKLFEMSYESDEYADTMTMALQRLCKLVNSKTPYSSFSRKYIELKIQDKPYRDVITQALGIT
ncbi:MAG: hypothetical protein IJE60_08720 [Tyzzerella sp.]|nr:hypothetical protein [Tyzzerella sp.]